MIARKAKFAHTAELQRLPPHSHTHASGRFERTPRTSLAKLRACSCDRGLPPFSYSTSLRLRDLAYFDRSVTSVGSWSARFVAMARAAPAASAPSELPRTVAPGVALPRYLRTRRCSMCRPGASRVLSGASPLARPRGVPSVRIHEEKTRRLFRRAVRRVPLEETWRA